MTVLASPSTNDNGVLRAARCNFVLVHKNTTITDSDDDVGIQGKLTLMQYYLTITQTTTGCNVAQLRAVFLPRFNDINHPTGILAYVQPLELQARDGLHLGGIIDNCRFRRSLRRDGR